MATPGTTDGHGQPVTPYQGRVVVADTSAWVIVRRAQREQPSHPLIAEFAHALGSGQVRACDAVKLELLHDARSPQAFVEVEERLDSVGSLPITTTASHAAIGALRDLSASAPPGAPQQHRVGHGDVLTAAIAAERGFGVLHYDRHFDLLSTVLNFDSIWITQAGGFSQADA